MLLKKLKVNKIEIYVFVVVFCVVFFPQNGQHSSEVTYITTTTLRTMGMTAISFSKFWIKNE